MKHRRAVSPLLATIMLIAITLAGSLLVWNFFTSMAQTQGESVQVQLVDVALLQSGTGTTVFSVTAKDTGSTPIASLAILLNGASLMNYTGPALLPGQSWSAQTIAMPSNVTVTIGETYIVTATATTSSGGSATTSQSVLCEGA